MCHVIIKSRCWYAYAQLEAVVAPWELCRRPPLLHAPTYVKNYYQYPNGQSDFKSFTMS